MKKKRQDAIRQIITGEEVCTQEELAQKLREMGYKVTQATVSRDIRELRLRKTISTSGKLIYSLPGGGFDLSDMGYGRILKESFTSIETAGSLLVLKTASGMAMAVAAAIDSMYLKGVAGCIAGDDTVMIAVRTPEDGRYVIKMVEDVIENVR